MFMRHLNTCILSGQTWLALEKFCVNFGTEKYYVTTFYVIPVYFDSIQFQTRQTLDQNFVNPCCVVNL